MHTVVSGQGPRPFMLVLTLTLESESWGADCLLSHDLLLQSTGRDCRAAPSAGRAL